LFRIALIIAAALAACILGAGSREAEAIENLSFGDSGLEYNGKRNICVGATNAFNFSLGKQIGIIDGDASYKVYAPSDDSQEKFLVARTD
jgi:hypothetical protein